MAHGLLKFGISFPEKKSLSSPIFYPKVRANPIHESHQTEFCSDGLIDLGERGNNNTLNSFKNDPCPYSDLPCNDDFLENETIFNADKAHAYKDAFYHSMV